MQIETEDEAFDYAKAIILAKGAGGPSTYEFIKWWADPWLRRQIHKQAARWSIHREDYEDLWQEAWAGVAFAPRDCTLDMIWCCNLDGRPVSGIAYRFMRREYRRRKKYREHEQTWTETDGIEKIVF